MSLPFMDVMTAAGAVGSVVVGGVYANFSLRIMPRLARLPEAEGITTMQEFNRVALQAPFMAVFFGTAIVSIVEIIGTLAKHQRTIADWVALAGGGFYLAGFLVTIVYNVPRNEQLAAVTAGSMQGSQVWQRYLDEWTSANSVRGVLSIIGAVGLAAGALLGIHSAR